MPPFEWCRGACLVLEGATGDGRAGRPVHSERMRRRHHLRLSRPARNKSRGGAKSEKRKVSDALRSLGVVTKGGVEPHVRAALIGEWIHDVERKGTHVVVHGHVANVHGRLQDPIPPPQQRGRIKYINGIINNKKRTEGGGIERIKKIKTKTKKEKE